MKNLKEIEAYLIDLEKREEDFKNKSIKKENNIEKSFSSKLNTYYKIFFTNIYSIFDVLILFLKIRFNKKEFKNKKFIYTAKNLCTNNHGVLEDRIVKPIFELNEIVYLSHAKEYRIDRIDNKKVYNTGGFVKLISKIFYRKHTTKMRTFLAYKYVNNMILKKLDNNEVYSLCYYDLNGLSLALSDYRENIVFGEVQHGSIINYPPYEVPAPFKLFDKMYVKNKETIQYLKEHLCKDFNLEYNLIPYPKVEREYKEGVNILYASTVEFNGFHPIFLKFLENNKKNNINLIVRLHPREKDKTYIFENILKKYNIKYKFDESKNWLLGNKIKNLIVVSPWSSTIEDSFDNQFITIVIDPVGQERYCHLIDNEKCYYSDNLNDTIENLEKEKKI